MPHLLPNHLTLAALLTVIISASSCKRESVPHAYDKGPLEALNKYEPKYKLDSDGRVIELKLENKQLDADAFDNLCKLTALRALSLYGSSVRDTDLEKLISVGQIRSLGLGKTAITDNGLSHLARLPRLRWLWINVGGNISANAVDKLTAAHPDLTVYPQ